ncbi:MAG: DNA polymerase III subunit epsilon [Alphaproteobacteria bacterium]|nr:DNA polymerase III subunit epsilon [Alphaproteobacteria bacterium]
MREIILDTETTGLDPEAGHRIVEIAALEVIDGVTTGKMFHSYVNPERDVPDEVYRIHGLSQGFLEQHPRFAVIADEFVDFISGATLVIHNAEFDMRFINAELARLRKGPIGMESVVDTVELARRRFPGAQASLDALCRRFGIDNSARTTHGARLDAELLAEVYSELTGGRQAGLGLDSAGAKAPPADAQPANARAPRPHAPTDEELEAHAELVKGLKNPIWTE